MTLSWFVCKRAGLQGPAYGGDAMTLGRLRCKPAGPTNARTVNAMWARRWEPGRAGRPGLHSGEVWAR